MLDVFLNVILPVFLVAAVAAVVQRWRKVAVGPLSQVTLYLLSPALIFTSLMDQTLPASTSGRIVLAMVLATALVLLAALAVSKLLRHDRSTQSAFLLATGFPNSGNLALPVLLLAFGEPGLAIGVVTFVTQAIAGQFLGIFVAARSQLRGLAPLREVAKQPAVYAIAVALLVRLLGIHLPVTLAAPVRLLSQAALPVMIVVLGLQLGSGVRVERAGSVLAAVAVRLLVSMPLAYLVATALGLSRLAAGVVVIVSSMPTAVFTTILATEFKASPRFVTSVVVASTLLSLVTLTVLISAVRTYILA